MNSPPSIAFAGSPYLLVAFRSGETVEVFFYNYQTRSFGGGYSPMHALNSDVDGRPQIAVSGQNVLLAWRRDGTDVVVIKGTISGGTITWGSPKDITPGLTDEFGAGGRSDPAAAIVGGTMYVAMVREGRGAPLHGFRTVVYSSADGSTWSEHSQTSLLRVVLWTHLSLAAKPDGRLMMASIRDTGVASAAKYDPTAGSWNSLSDASISQMFGGSTAANRPFALFSRGSS